MIVAGNWKMNMGYKKALSFLSEFKKLIQDGEEKHFVFLPPSTLSFLFQKEKFYWGGQNVHFENEGAFTGENSAQVLKEMGASFCLLGHSERRLMFSETDKEVEKKFELLHKNALIPILCVGESLDNRFEKKKILTKQLSWIKNNASSLPAENIAPLFNDIPFIIAYEPIWSIGTGETPSSSELEEALLIIKEQQPLAKIFYGGSVNKKSLDSFLSCSLDGFLVGGASLDPHSFYGIYKGLKDNKK